ncbi:DUF3237 domain-containing protein [uncultured Ferrovibrio sp.]|jgi:Protein of unknown function (DUF3237).|uniref:DUF3237 domain-containing protein n=1 Tax=uncultured Ferrovibrio sp. TaxID=1576913 RepID=UPI00261F00E5|nr:DUF3237 domain-containing protein [uncultured Ferrovibrio sp.]
MLSPIFDLEVEVATPQSIGRGEMGERRCIPIAGGRLKGKLNGKVLPGGADWQVLRPDGMADLDAHYMLVTDAGEQIEVWSRGLRSGPPEVMARLARGESVDPASYYFRTALRFETAAPQLQWLVHRLAIGYGERRPDQVLLKVYAVD